MYFRADNSRGQIAFKGLDGMVSDTAKWSINKSPVGNKRIINASEVWSDDYIKNTSKQRRTPGDVKC